MEIQSIRFQKEEGSVWKKGVMIRSYNSDLKKVNNIIVDMNSNPIECPVWDIRELSELIVNYHE